MTVLVVCRTAAQIPLLASIRQDPVRRYIVASDDPLVRENARAAGFDEISWLEQMESMYDVAADVLSLLGTVNRWLARCGHDTFGIPRNLMPWMQHVEGGFTTQRLQDATLLVRSYTALFEQYDVRHVVLCSDGTAWFDDSVLRAVAQVRGIRVERCGSPVDTEGDGRVVRAVKRVARGPYRTLLECTSLLKRRAPIGSQTPDDGSRHIIFQLGSAAEKHIESIVPLMKVLQKHGRCPVAVSCFVPAAAEKIRNNGLIAVEAGSFLTLKTCLAAARRQLFTLGRAAFLKRHFFGDPALSYQGVPLAAVMWRPVKDFLMTDLVTRYCLSQALERCFQEFPPAAVRPWGETSLVEGYVACQLLKRRQTLLFDYWTGIGIDWPYWNEKTPIELFLAAGATQHEELRRLGVSEARIVRTGSTRYTALNDLRDRFDAIRSRKHLGVPEGYELYVFWDQNVVHRGTLSAQEQLLAAKALLEITRRRRCAVLVKPHPSHHPGALDRWLDSSATAGVFRLPPASLPYHALNASDVVVTKMSTIAVEAMVLNKPVMSVILDAQPRWRIFGDGVEYFTDVDRIKDHLMAIIDDREYLAAWTMQRRRQQSLFVSRYFADGNGRPEELAADAIAARLARVPPAESAA